MATGIMVRAPIYANKVMSASIVPRSERNVILPRVSE